MSKIKSVPHRFLWLAPHPERLKETEMIMQEATRRATASFATAVILLLAGWIVPAFAAPKDNAPGWSLSQSVNENGQEVVTLTGFVPADWRGEYSFMIYGSLGNQCNYSTDCGNMTCQYNCPAGLRCNWVSLSAMLVDSSTPRASQQGAGWTVTAEYRRTGLAVTATLAKDFLIGRRLLQFSVQGNPSKAGFPYLNGGTSLDEAFSFGAY